MKTLVAEAVREAVAEQSEDAALALAIAERVVEKVGDRLLLSIETNSALAAGATASAVEHAVADAAGSFEASVSRLLEEAKEERRALGDMIERNADKIERGIELLETGMGEEWAADARALAVECDATLSGLSAADPRIFGDITNTLGKCRAFLDHSSRYFAQFG